MTKWWVSCKKFTFQVNTDKDWRITFAPPVVRRFKGQPLGNLLYWLQAFGGLKYEQL